MLGNVRARHRAVLALVGTYMGPSQKQFCVGSSFSKKICNLAYLSRVSILPLTSLVYTYKVYICNGFI